MTAGGFSASAAGARTAMRCEPVPAQSAVTAALAVDQVGKIFVT